LPLQLGVQALELFEPVHPPVVRRIVDQRGVAPVVRVLRLEDARGQIFGLDAGVFQRDVLRHPISLRAGADILRPRAGWSDWRVHSGAGSLAKSRARMRAASAAASTGKDVSTVSTGNPVIGRATSAADSHSSMRPRSS